MKITSKIKSSLASVLFLVSIFSTNLLAQAPSFVMDIPGQNLQFLNANRALIHNAGNNGLAVGSIWRYDNLLTTKGITIYGVLTIKEINNASITTLDDEVSGQASRFQPQITSLSGGGYVLFQLDFYEVITDGRVYISDYYFTAMDVDGSEYIELGGYSSYEVDATCGLTITHNEVTGRTRFGGITGDLSAITFENTAAFVGRYVFPYTTVTFALGKSNAGTNRQYSTQFGTAGGSFSNPTTVRNPQKLLYLTKVADTDHFVAGATHQYTITIENGGSTADSVKLTDLLPAKLTYVPNSTSVYIPAATVTETVADNFNQRSYALNSGSILWKGNWVEGGADAITNSPTTGVIQVTTTGGGRLQFSSTTASPVTNGTLIERKIDLSRADNATLTFDYPAIALSTGTLSVQFSVDGTTYVNLGTLSGTTPGSFSAVLPPGALTADTRIRFTNVGGSSWADGRNISIDDVKVTYTFSQPAQTKTNKLVGGTLADGTPSNLLKDEDQITILPGGKAIITFDVKPNCDATGTVVNTATVTCPNLYQSSISASHTAYLDPTDVTGNSRCNAGTLTLQAAGAGANQDYRWYNAPTGGTLLQDGGDEYTTSIISTTTDYYVSFYNTLTGCESGRTKVTAVVSTGMSGVGIISTPTGQNGTSLNTGAQNGASALNNSSEGTVAWSNPGNASGGDNVAARATAGLGAGVSSNYLDITFPAITGIPDLSTITGISVSVDRSSITNSGIRDQVIQLLKNNTVAGSNLAATTTNWPTTEATATYGGASNLWGTTWDVTDLATLGLRIQVRNANSSNARTASVDYVSITVYYSRFGDDQSNVQFTVSGITGATGYTWTVPAWATITHGQGSEKIFVDFNNAGQSGTYNICVTPKDDCVVGTQICKTLGVSNNVNNEISGTIYRDDNGSVAPQKVDGIPVSTIAGQQLYAILTTNSNSNALSSIAVAPDGTYKFSYLSSTLSNYYRVYINTQPFGDGVTASSGLPAGASWAGEIDNNTDNSLTGRTSTVGWLTVTAGNNTNNTNVNFGITINNPVANDDLATTNEDNSVTLNITDNDTSPSGTIDPGSVDLDPLTPGVQTTFTTSNGTWELIDGSGNLKFTPTLDYFGKDSIRYVVKDTNGWLSDPGKVVVTVRPVNDLPSFTKGANQVVDNNAGAVTVTNWATSISKGPSNESVQTVQFITSNDDNSLFNVQPYVDSDGNLHYTPKPGASGTTTVSVKIKDNGGTANGGIDESAIQTFTITINNTANYWIGTESTDWNDVDNWTAGSVPASGEDIEFATAANNSGNPAVEDLHLDTDRVIGNLINASDKDLVITTGNQLVINGTVQDSNPVAGTIVVKADSGQPTGTLIFDDPVANPNVQATVEFYNKAYECDHCGYFRKQWQYFGIPVRESGFPYLIPQVETVRQWVESFNGDKWRPAPYAPDLNLKAFNGYQVTNSSTTLPTHIYQFTGSLYTGNAPVSLTQTANVNYPGMNLIGNSYTAALPISTAAISFATGLLEEETVYLFNTGTRDQWRKLDGSTTTGVSGGQYQAIPFGLAGMGGLPGTIPSMHTFMLKAHTPGTLTLNYNELVKMVTDATTPAWRVKQQNQNNYPYVVMDLIGETSADRVWLFEIAGTSTGFDTGWDGRKLLEEGAVQAYVAGDNNEKYQVAAVPDLAGTTFGMYVAAKEEYTINLSVDPRVETRNMYIRDMVTGEAYPLRNEAEYLIAGLPEIDSANRFKIVRDTSMYARESENLLEVVALENGIVVSNNSTEDCTVTIYHLSGKLLAQQQVLKGATERLTGGLTSGVYLVKISGSQLLNKTQRVILL